MPTLVQIIWSVRMAIGLGISYPASPPKATLLLDSLQKVWGTEEAPQIYSTKNRIFFGAICTFVVTISRAQALKPNLLV